jgi:hypothetical protein
VSGSAAAKKELSIRPPASDFIISLVHLQPPIIAARLNPEKMLIRKSDVLTVLGILCAFDVATATISTRPQCGASRSDFYNKGTRQENKPSTWSKSIRDAIVQRVFGIKSDVPDCVGSRQTTRSRRAKQSTSYLPNVQAMYERDIVLRFTIKSKDEALALVEASNILFLDVWGSSQNWVDIRLSKDMVCRSIHCMDR